MTQDHARDSRAVRSPQRRARPVAEVLEGRQLLATITVTSTGDADGADGSTTISLRQAIEIANWTLAVSSLTAGQQGLVVGVPSRPDTIDFAIPGAGPFTIEPATLLPTITVPVVIDGYSEPGAHLNTGGPGQADDAVIRIEISGAMLPDVGSYADFQAGLRLTGGDSTVQGLAIGAFTSPFGFSPVDGIDLLDRGGDVIRGDFIGTDATGTVAQGNSGNGVYSNVDVTIGGTTPADRDVISGNTNGPYDGGLDVRGLVEGNFIGTDASGSKALGNTGFGVAPTGPVTIGGTAVGAGNLISGNAMDGISGGGLVEGNLIGTDLTGTRALANSIGVHASFGSSTIGGTTAAARNVISGNQVGVEFGSFGGEDNLVEGNLIGTDASGTVALPNGSAGIEAYDIGHDTIGGTAAGAGNVISGNAGNGLEIRSYEADLDELPMAVATTSESVEGNLIGIAADGVRALANGGAGIRLSGVGCTIGGTAGAGNVISGNAGAGIDLESSGNLVEGNLIGTDPNGTRPVPNGKDGIADTSTGADTIGGTAAGAGNVISGNVGSGLSITGQAVTVTYPETSTTVTYAADSLVEGNLIGVDATGTKPLGNGKGGIVADLARAFTVGGTAAGAGNIISGNVGSGLSITGQVFYDEVGYEFSVPTSYPSDGDLVAGNFIGVDATGSRPLGNASGIVADLATSFTIGGTAAGAGNVISGNLGDGIEADEASGIGLIQGNLIGVGVSGESTLPNGGAGIRLAGTGCTVGGTAAGGGNVISGNGSDGLVIASRPVRSSFQSRVDLVPAADNLVQGNAFGTDRAGTTGLGNAGDGVRVAGSSNTIGGTAAGAGNIIAFNRNSGVGVVLAIYAADNPINYGAEAGRPIPGSGQDDLISGNSIFANVGLGIDLGGDGVTPNNPAGSPAGPNLLQPYPVLTSAVSTSAVSTATDTVISATLDALPSTAYTVEFFANPAADPSGFGEGQTYLGSTSVTTDAAGHAAFIFTVASNLEGLFLSATATDPMGNTSEFARDVIAAPPTQMSPPPPVGPTAPSATTTTLIGPPSASVFGQPVPFAAVVAPTTPGGARPTGLVAFIEGSAVLGQVPLDANGVALFFSNTLAPGSAVISAVYLGDASNANSLSNYVEATIRPTTTTTTLIGPPFIASAKTPLPFAAVVAPSTTGAALPTGVVAFFEDGVILGEAPLDASGVAVFVTASIPPASHVVAAVYLGDATDVPSLSNYVAVSVLPRNTARSHTSPVKSQTIRATRVRAAVSNHAHPSGPKQLAPAREVR